MCFEGGAVNLALPDELLEDVLGRVGSGPGASKRDLDACVLVCRRWRRLEPASRRSAKLPAGRPLRANIPSAA